jgi:exosortase E/protease (VPEID-CTERM system)
VGLLALEFLALTNRYDPQVLEAEDLWWAHWLAGSRHFLAWAIPAVAAVLVCQGARLRDELGRLTCLVGRHRWWVFALGHLGAIAVFTALTAFLLGTEAADLPAGAAWFAAWLGAVVAALVLWGAALWPLPVWGRLAVRHGIAVLVTGAVVGSAAWGAGQLARVLWLPLARSTLETVRRLLGLVCSESDLVCQPGDFVVGTTRFRVAIAPACSGYEGIGLILVLLTTYLWLFRRELRFPRALLLVPAGIAAIWLSNAARIATLVLIGSWGRPDVALSGFHSQAGWLLFCAVGLALVALSRQSRFFAAPSAWAAARRVSGSEWGWSANPTAAYIGPLLALVAGMMVTGLFTSAAEFDRFYPVRVLAAGGILWFYRGEYPDLRWTRSWTAVAIGVAVFAVWMALEAIAGAGAGAGGPPGKAGAGAAVIAAGLAGLPPGGAATWLFFRAAGSITVVPLAEELAFRGFLIRRLIRAEFTEVPPGRFTWPSFLISSILFGALHGRWLAGTIAGLFYALALYRRRELGDAVVAHATTNALIAAYVLTTGTWSLW